MYAVMLITPTDASQPQSAKPTYRIFVMGVDHLARCHSKLLRAMFVLSGLCKKLSHVL